MKLALTPTLLYTAIASALLGISLVYLDPGYMSLWQTTFTFVGLFTLSLTTQLFGRITGNKSIVSLLAIMLAVGGGYIAYTGWEEFFQNYQASSFSRLQLNGDIGQPNLFGSLLLISWLAALYLFSHIPNRWLRYLGYFAALILYGTPLPFTGSRTVLLSLGGVFGIALLSFWRLRTPEPKRLSSAIIIAMLLGMIGQFAIPPAVAHFAGTSNRSTLNRIEAGGITASQRLRTDEWKKSAQLWANHPIGGVGVGRYAYHSFQLQQLPPYNEVARDKVYDHSHNLFTQIAAETGSVGLVLTIGMFLTWLIQQRRVEKSAATLLCWTGLTVLFIHSNLEFPLWYWYLLIPFTVMLASTEGETTSISIPSPLVGLVWAAGVAGFSWALYTTYIGAEQVANGYGYSDDQPEKARSIGRIASKNPFVGLEADQMMSYLDTGAATNLQDKLARNTRLLYWRPYASVVYRRALLMAQTGNLPEAQRWLVSALSVYPNERNEYFEPMLQQAPASPNVNALKAFYNKAVIALVLNK